MKKLLSILLTVALLVSVLAGCGDTSSNESAAPESGSSAAAESPAAEPEAAPEESEPAEPEAAPEESEPAEKVEVKHVVAATAGRPKPFIYTNEDGSVTGFEAEVLYAVDELLEEYEIEVEVCEFASILTGIDAGIYDLGFNNLSRNEEREQTYRYSDEYVGYSFTGVVVRIDDDSIQSLADLGGKTAPSKVSGSPTQLYMEQYNEENPDNAINLVYTTAEDLKVIQDVIEGVYDFNFIEATVWESYLEEYPDLADSLKFVTFSEEETEQFDGNSYSWYLFPRTEEGEALAQAVDGALRQLKEDGTLNEIAQEYLHYDVVW